MPTKRAAGSAKKTGGSTWNMPKPLPLVMLLVGLALSAFNLSLMTSQAGSLAGVTNSFDLLRMNYGQRRTTVPHKAPPPETTMKKEEPKPVVLFSVVKFREGEEAALRTSLTGPLVAFYGESRWPIPLMAVLIERRNASSRDVNVRLFFSDGSEQSYLWPNKNSEDGKWIPPCTADPASSSADVPLCPPTFSAMYPDLVDLTR